MAYMSGFGEAPRPPSPGEGELGRGERGYRRQKWAAFAGNLYRTGQQAVMEIRETYAQSRARDLDDGFDSQGGVHIPGAFPDVAIAAYGDEQMVLFPCYAKRHVRRHWGRASTMQQGQDEDYWRQQWERAQDEKAIVDVDVRGWIYSPLTGPMTRRNRFLVGLARQLSGIAPPRTGDQVGAGYQPTDETEQGKIAQEAAKIEQIGQEERRAAMRGAYSEQPQTGGSGSSLKPPGSNGTPRSMPGTPALPPRQPSTGSATSTELTETELAVANANLMARIAPFMTTPVVALTITIFFYNETESQSRTVTTNDAGHFSVRAALDFVPTHVRVLANERLSAIQEISIIEPYGVSLISDIDDTVKMSNIAAGAREIFRNTFVRELGDLSIEGVREWYNDMHALGVSVHYCSNSPWQLFPMLATFFKTSGLPEGSLHLKQYSGMLQGIFEPVAERKKDTLTRLLRDFPHRKFLLVGDSGEVDLEVYTELATSYPGRILAVFIRDVTTPEGTNYSEPSSLDLARQGMSSMTLDEGRARQKSATAKQVQGPVMGTLIDFSEEPQEANLDEGAALEQVQKQTVSAIDLLSRRQPPPPRPIKPAALSRAPSWGDVGETQRSKPPPPPPKPVTLARRSFTDLSSSSSQASRPSTSSTTTGATDGRPPPPPRRRATGRGTSAASDVDTLDPLTPSAVVASPFSAAGMGEAEASPSESPTLGAANKKLELWRRRLGRAQEQLDAVGTGLYTWRRGGDVEAEARGIIKRALREMEKRRRIQ